MSDFVRQTLGDYENDEMHVRVHAAALRRLWELCAEGLLHVF